MKYILYGFGGSFNHGGEAIVQTTCEIIRSIDNDATIVLSTHFKEQDEMFHLPVDKYCCRDLQALQMEKEDGNRNRYTTQVYRELLDEIESDSVVMSVGGDNYCYDNWRKWTIIHNYAKKMGAKTVFWSCSIEPAMISKEMIEHLLTFDLITAREGATYQALLQAGLTNVTKCYDVAFSLKPKTIALPQGMEKGNTIAINLSPLVLRRENCVGAIKRNLRECIDDILRETPYKVLLIPHVLMPVDNDLDALSEIKESYKDEDRVILYKDNCHASEYKFLISQCRLGIFARTHASIAAYSSMIPTIVLGYSIKSIGIAGDLGMESYVLQSGELEDGQLSKCLHLLLKNEDSVKKQLMAKKEEMHKGVENAVMALKETLR